MEQTDLQFEEQVRGHQHGVLGLKIDGAARRLQPWRKVVTPYQDVVSVHHPHTEFAADLWQAHLGQGVTEYCDPAARPIRARCGGSATGTRKRGGATCS